MPCLHGCFPDEAGRARTGQPARVIHDSETACGSGRPTHKDVLPRTGSGALLIRKFGVQVPGGAPRLTWPFTDVGGGPESSCARSCASDAASAGTAGLPGSLFQVPQACRDRRRELKRASVEPMNAATPAHAPLAARTALRGGAHAPPKRGMTRLGARRGQLASRSQAPGHPSACFCSSRISWSKPSRLTFGSVCIRTPRIPDAAAQTLTGTRDEITMTAPTA